MATSASAPIDPSRRAALLGIKLRALVRDHLGADPRVDEGRPSTYTRGAALVLEDAAWVLLDDQPARGLGGALAWAQRAAADRGTADLPLNVVTESASGVLARRAALFREPPSVWHAVDRMLVPAVPEPRPVEQPLAPEHEALRELIVAGGAEPVVEHGVLAGEVRGLEVCRAVTDPSTGETRLEVGVGAHDREAFALLHGARPTVEALADVVGAVTRHRSANAAHHPLNTLAAERLLRWEVLAEPARVGARDLAAASPPVVRSNLKDPVPCVALGTAVDGGELVVVCSTGIDLDLVPFALDARAMHAPDAELILVVPERDVSPVTAALAAAASHPPRLVGWARP